MRGRGEGRVVKKGGGGIGVFLIERSWFLVLFSFLFLLF